MHASIVCRRNSLWWDGAASGEAGAEFVMVPCRKPGLANHQHPRDFTSVILIAKLCQEGAIQMRFRG